MNEQVDRTREVMIACKTLRTEIEHVMGLHGVERRIVWIESKLHTVPVNLKDALQQALDEVEDADRVLLGFGNCGNVIQGLKTGDFELIVPCIDDCVSLVMGSQKRRDAYSRANHSLFLTDGWMNTGHTIIDEYKDAYENYGEEDALDILDMMYAHYETMTYLDTGLYDVGELMERTRTVSDLLKLEQKVEPATLAYIELLVCGPWDEGRFVHVPPHSTIPAAPFMVPGSVLLEA